MRSALNDIDDADLDALQCCLYWCLLEVNRVNTINKIQSYTKTLKMNYVLRSRIIDLGDTLVIWVYCTEKSNIGILIRDDHEMATLFATELKSKKPQVLVPKYPPDAE